MDESLRRFLSGIIDYAGMFPPARLALDAAIRNFARYQRSPDAWMLARFICPAAKLDQLAPYAAELFDPERPLRCSILAGGDATAEEFLAHLRADLRAVAAFCDEHADRVTVEVIEARLPAERTQADDPEVAAGRAAAPDHAQVASLVDQACEVIRAGAPSRVSPFFEVGLTPAWRTVVPAVINGLAAHNGKDWDAPGRCGDAGFKLRCGGLEAASFPTAEQVAAVIGWCRDADVPLKATAGLHHPVRHFAADVRAKMHGFLNVFGAGILARTLGLDHRIIRDIIEDDTPDRFVFESDGFRWKDLRAGCEAIEAARQRAVTSFGSCSFDEPVEDLRGLGLL